MHPAWLRCENSEYAYIPAFSRLASRAPQHLKLRTNFFANPKAPLIRSGDRRIIGRMIGAGNEIRTRDTKLGKLVLYQLSYARPMPKPY